MTEIITADLSLAELKALVAEQEAAVSTQAVEQGREFLTTLARNNVAQPGKSPNSTWVGHVSKVSITIDDVAYEVTVSFKDMPASKVLAEKRETAKLLEKHGDAIAAIVASAQAKAAGGSEG